MPMQLQPTHAARYHTHSAHAQRPIALTLPSPPSQERKSQWTQFHPTFPIEKCGKCQMCVNPQMKQSCLFMRTAQIAHKRVYSAMVALERSRAIGKRVGVFWSHERKWYMAVITGEG